MKDNVFIQIIQQSKRKYKYLTNIRLINVVNILIAITLVVSLGSLLFGIFYNHSGFSNYKPYIVFISLGVLFACIIAWNIFTYMRKKANIYFDKLINFKTLYEQYLTENNLIDKPLNNSEIINEDIINKLTSYSSYFNEFFYTKWHSQYLLSNTNLTINFNFWKAFYLNDKNKKCASSHFLLRTKTSNDSKILISSKNIDKSLFQVSETLYANINLDNQTIDYLENLRKYVGEFIINNQNGELELFMISNDNFLMLQEKDYNTWKYSIDKLALKYSNDKLVLVSIIELIQFFVNNY